MRTVTVIGSVIQIKRNSKVSTYTPNPRSFRRLVRCLSGHKINWITSPVDRFVIILSVDVS